MFSYMKGRLVEMTPTSCIIDVNGIGYWLFIPISTYEKLEIDREQLLYTRLLVKDDRYELYGFSTVEEKKLFEDLIAVRGIGGKLAIVILSGLSPERFREAVRSGDVTAISSIKGVGAKTAKRLILELKDKLIIEGPSVLPVVEDTILALISLGYTRADAKKAVQKVNIRSQKVEDLIKAALKAK